MKGIFKFFILITLFFASTVWGETICFLTTYFGTHQEEVFFAPNHGWEKGINSFYLAKQHLAPLGYQLHLIEKRNNFKGADALILCNFPKPKDLRALEKSGIPKERRVLFLYEPPTVDPYSYDPIRHELVGRVYTWNDALVDNKKYFKFNYAVRKPMQRSIIPFEKKKLCTLIARNKRSTHPDELYSKRVEAIRFFEEFHPGDFDLFGRKWPVQEYPSYRGELHEKAPILGCYRFSVCYENMTNIQGYITEKIFDCFHAGCVPIYWGASNVKDYIPADCFIDRCTFETWEELYQFLRNMTEEEHQRYLDNIRAFLDSEKSYPFAPECHADLLYEIVKGLKH